MTDDLPGSPPDWTPDPAGTPERLAGGSRSGRHHAKSKRGAGGTASQGGRKRRRWLRRTVIGTAVVVVLAMVLGAGGYFYINYRLGHIAKVKVGGLVKQPSKPGQPFNILLVGSDTRSFCTTASCQSHLGNQGAAGGQRSDVIIIMRVVPADKKILMLSIPRDTWVTIADSGGQGNRINAAFNTGPTQLVETIEQDFHIPINHYAYANFLGFTNAVQDLGGVWMNFPDKLRDTNSGLNITKTGCQYVNGVESLELVRSRDTSYFANGQWNYDGLGDLSRIRRQQAFFHALIDRADGDRNPLSINAFIIDATKQIVIDSTFTTGDLGVTGARVPWAAVGEPEHRGASDRRCSHHV